MPFFGVESSELNLSVIQLIIDHGEVILLLVDFLRLGLDVLLNLLDLLVEVIDFVIFFRFLGFLFICLLAKVSDCCVEVADTLGNVFVVFVQSDWVVSCFEVNSLRVEDVRSQFLAVHFLFGDLPFELGVGFSLLLDVFISHF